MKGQAYKVIGLDPSCTATGVVVLGSQPKGPPLVWAAKQFVCQGTGLTRAVAQVELLDEILTSSKVRLAVVEGYAFANRHSLAKLVEVGTCLRLALLRRGVPYVEIPPSRLKMFATGRGDADKKAIKAAVQEKWGYTPKTHNVADAFVLSMLGMAYLGSYPWDLPTEAKAMLQELDVHKG